jgi:ankyrin repeat protein
MPSSAALTNTMDPLSAIGLASSIVQFIDFGLKVAKRLDELNNVNPGDVPKSLQAISSQLPLLLNALSRIKTDAQLKNLDFDTKCILRGMISGCRSQIVEVENMIDDISHAPGDTFKTKIKKVFTSMKYDEKVREIERNLQTYISVLILHHVIDSADAPLELADDTFFDVREERVETFVERLKLMKELDGCLYDASRSRVQAPTILLISGDKGVGKTQLALEFCHRAHSLKQFRTIFWLDASTLENLYLGFESIYATVRRSTDGSRKEKISFVIGFLSDLWHPWLLVLDNYEASALYNNIMELLPSRGYGGIILITRGDAKNGLGKVIEVSKFLPPEEQNQLNSLLTQEVQRKDFEGMKNLVNQGADVNTLIWNEWPCLHRLALFGLEDAFTFFLERGADPNPPTVKIMKPLYWAAGDGHESICSLLLDNEDETRQFLKAADYQAAFNQAMEKGSLDIVKMIWKRREVTLSAKNQYDYTPLQNAANKGHVEIVKFLIDQGALREDHEQGDHALILAASEGHFDVIKLLCSEGKVDPNAQYGSDKRTALYCVAGLTDKKGREEKREEMAKFLLDKGADPNRFENQGPLHQAATHDHANMIRLLLEHGADPMKGSNNYSPLHVAIHYESPEAIKLFLQCKIRDPAAWEAWLDRCLLSAASTGHRDAVLQLLKAGANINTPQEEGYAKGATGLLLSIFNGQIKTAQLLIRQGKFLQLCIDF